MNRLLEIGFQYAGNWSLIDDCISYTLKHHENDKHENWYKKTVNKGNMLQWIY